MPSLKRSSLVAAIVGGLLLLRGITVFPASKTSTPASKRSFRLQQLLDRELQSNFSAPENRVAGPFISNSITPYILMHTGCREVDNNGSWKRHAVKDAFGNLHVLYPVFDGNTTTNNRNQYNCLAAGASAMTYAAGSEPHANPPQNDQNGGINALPSCRAVWVGRGVGGNNGSVFSVDSGPCLGLIRTGIVCQAPFCGDLDPRRALDPAIYVVSESTWVVLAANFNDNGSIGGFRTTDAGQTWTDQIPVIVSSFVNFAVTGRGSTIYVFFDGCAGG